MTEKEYFRPIDDLAVGTIWVDDCGFRWIYMGNGKWRGMCTAFPTGDVE